MGISVVKRPFGRRTDNIGSLNASASNSSGSVLITNSGSQHGLTTGAYVYIYSLLSAYNGFWYVTVTTANSFKISEYDTAVFQEFINSGDVTYYVSRLDSEWMCAHWPIVYKLLSTKWPTNSVDTSRTVSSFANDSGYVKLTLSGSLGTFEALDWITITGSSTTGIYQILTKNSSSIITINLSYSASYSFTYGTVILYYNNYHASIRVYAGLESGHVWYTQKPFELILTVNVVPDADGLITFNVNEYIKKKLPNMLKNNLQLDTLPNNLDFWTQFYITFAETYDSSNGTTVSTYSTDYVDHGPDGVSLKGYAVNAKLPFKNRFAGFLMEYVYGGTPDTLQKFLTNFTRPTLFTGKYFDLSFLATSGEYQIYLYLIQKLYSNGILTGTQANGISDLGNIGVIRRSLTQIGSEDRQDVYLAITQNILPPDQWTDGANPFPGKGPTFFFKNLPTPTVTYSAYQAAILQPGVGISVDVTVTGTIYNTPTSGLRFDLSILDVVGGTKINTFTWFQDGSLPPFSAVVGLSNVSASPTTVLLVEARYDGTSLGDVTITINNVGVPLDYQPISETITIDVNSRCENQSRYLTWLNNLGGFDYWSFSARKTYGRDILKVQTQDKNIFTDYPNSIGEFAQSVTSEISRKTKKREVIRSQNLTLAQVDALAAIKDSPLIQILESQYSQRTVLVDTQSFDIRKDGDKKWMITFTIQYTDEVSSQEL